MTIHDIAQRASFCDRAPHLAQSCPDWLADKIKRGMRRSNLRRRAKYAIQVWEQQTTQHLERDYRGWNVDGTRDGPGSGRTADWLDSGFRHYAIEARAIHRLTGYRDDSVRQIVRTLRQTTGGCGWDAWPGMMARIEALPPCPVEATYWPHGYDEDFDRDLAARPPASAHTIAWSLLWQWDIGLARAEADLQQEIERLRSDPQSHISGYLADSILSWRAGRRGYEGCSGVTWYALVRARLELWDELIARAPTHVQMPVLFL